VNIVEGNIRCLIMSNSAVYKLLLVILLFPSFCFAQSEFDTWYFGNRAGVSFALGSPVALTDCAESFRNKYVSAGMSDSLGNLLFYAGIYYPSQNLNGTVYNRNHQIMPNGHNLYTGWETKQNYLATGKPDTLSQFYLFTMDEEWSPPAYPWPYPHGLTYSVIDMNLDGGLGDIVPGEKSVLVPGALMTGQMLAGTRHHNNRNAWITVRGYYNSSTFLTYLISGAGLDTIPVISQSLVWVTYPYADTSGWPCMIRFSPDGTKMAAVYRNKFEFCSFNSSTGQITPLFIVSIPQGNNPYAEFSINSKLLYVIATASGGQNIYQYDATKTNLADFTASMYLVATQPSNQGQNPGMQRGPDHKIYITNYDFNSLDVVNDPDIQGSGCNYQSKAVSLVGNVPNFGLPQYIERYYAYLHHTGSCVNHAIPFTSVIWPQADSIHWDFGDPASGPANFSNLPNPSHIYTNIGTYTVELFVRHIDNRTDTTWQTITIIASPQVALGPDRTICTGNSTAFDAGACPGCAYLWKDLGSGLTVGTAQTFTTGLPGDYSVTVTNSNGCIGSDTVHLSTTPVPSITNNPLSKSICTGESTNISLTSNVPGTTFNWTATLTSGNISGFSADSGLVINQVLVNPLSTAGIVTYHITPKVGSCSGATVDFPVTVNPGDSVKVSISASANNICEGIPVTFTATPTNGGTTPLYNWKVNGITVGTNSPNYTYSPVNGDLVTCVLTSSNTVCTSNNPATSYTIQMIVNPLNPVSITIAPSTNPVCAGIPVTFTAATMHGGPTPSYQWKVNGANAGTNLPIYTYTPASGDLVSCILTSNIQCPSGNPASSNTVIMDIMDILVIGISISASQNPVCAGSPVTLTATPVNGGSSPFYQWKVNGIGVGTNSSIYSYIPVNGDQVSCDLTSSEPCPVANPVTSNILQITINNNFPAGISISASANPFCPGNSVTFTATPVNGGANPAYQWKVNGTNTGTNSPTYTYNPASGDLVSCLLTSNLACVTGNPATSNTIIMSGTLAPIVTFTRCFDSITTTTAKPFRLKGGIPLGGTYSGAGVAGGIFNPGVAGVGTHLITYTYTNAALCSASAVGTIGTIGTVGTSCGQNFTDIRDGKSYSTVQIGSQCWMAEDLAYGYTIDESTNQRDNCIPEKYIRNSSSVIRNYYHWDEIMNYGISLGDQGLCPPNWHVPSEADWNTLFANYTSNAFAASPLKYTGFSGFDALLAGARHLNKMWDYSGFAGFFWSATAHGVNKAWGHGMNAADPSVSLYPALRSNAFSVRCLRD
jgi:uncharacterized protein (TIGR02145 family)